MQPDATSTFAGGGSSRPRIGSEFATAAVEVRNTGATSVGPGYLWTARRTYPLLGETLPERQVSDLLAAVALLQAGAGDGTGGRVWPGLHGSPGHLCCDSRPADHRDRAGRCPTSHEDPQTPEFLGVLRIGDLPHNLALAYPRTITFVGEMPEAYTWTRNYTRSSAQGDRIRVIRSMRDWRPVETRQ